MALRLRHRLAALLLTIFVSGTATLFGAASASAALPRAPEAPGLCTTDEWRTPSEFNRCVKQLKQVPANEALCVQAPTPDAPDSGMAGWFASRPDSSRQAGPQGLYSDYGYAGYSYTTYDVGNCVKTAMHPDYKFENTTANGEFLLASSVIGASNALRERAWDPKTMWGWADPLVEKATKAVYQRVFTVFGTITLAVVGLYLLWRSRQADMSIAMTTAGWAVLVMVVVTALAQWPTWSANAADQTLIGSLSVVHDAVGPPAQDTPPDKCPNPDPAGCIDHRPPAVRASDTATDGMLYRNWLRGELGSADTETAKKYGPVLYDAKSFTWDEIEDIRKDPSQRQVIIDRKQQHWMAIAKQIKTEDPEAYEYLQGTKGMERIGAGFIAILASLFYALFDIVASLLILLGFLIFRWAVVAAPLLGTVGMLRPASGGLRRLVNVVVAALFNILIFGTAAAIYLFAVDLIMSTAGLAGWLQVVLIGLSGVVGWMLLRPYRRITQLGGKESGGGSAWGRFLLRESRQAAERRHVDSAIDKAVARGGETAPSRPRPEARSEQPTVTVTVEEEKRAAPARRSGDRSGTWTEPDLPDDAPSYTVYRPDSGDVTIPSRAARSPEPARSRG